MSYVETLTCRVIYMGAMPKKKRRGIVEIHERIIRDKGEKWLKINLILMIKLKRYDKEYRVVGINLDTLSCKSKIIWYKLCRISDGYVCIMKDNQIEIII